MNQNQPTNPEALPDRSAINERVATSIHSHQRPHICLYTGRPTRTQDGIVESRQSRGRVKSQMQFESSWS